MHNYSLNGSFIKTKLIHQNLISDEGRTGGRPVSDFFLAKGGGGVGQFLTLADKGGGGSGPFHFWLTSYVNSPIFI